MSAAEYSFRIAGFTPETLPMVRLAEYLGDFAKLLGSPEHVHFGDLKDGSAVLVAAVDQEARPVVNPRVRAATRGDGSKEAVGAWNRLNEMLGRDNTSATLEFPGGEVIPFPGSAPPAKPIGPVRQDTTIQGRIVRLEGYGEDISVGVEDETGLTGRVVVKATHASEIGELFHRYVRFAGSGKWRRDTDGQWCLEHLDVTSFEALDEQPLDETLRQAGEFLPQGASQRAIEIIRELRRA